MRRAVMLGVLGALISTGAFAEESTVALRDVTAVQDGRGSARVLFRVGTLPAFDHVFVESAVLTIPYTGEPEERALALRVCPVTGNWQGAGQWDTEFDSSVYARGTLDLRRGGGTMNFDVTVAVQEILEGGVTADGFVLTSASPTEGLPAGDLSRLGSSSGAALHLKTTGLPSGRPSTGWIARHGG